MALLVWKTSLNSAFRGVDLKQGFQFPEVKKKKEKTQRLHSYPETTFFTGGTPLESVTVTFERETLKLEDVIFF